MIARAIQVLLLRDATVTGLVVDRIYPIVLPTPVTFPAVSFQRISEAPTHLQRGPGGTRVRIQVDSWARTYNGARDLSRAVRDVLDFHSGWVTEGSLNVAVLGSFLAASRDLYEQDTKIYRASLDFNVWAQANAA